MKWTEVSLYTTTEGIEIVTGYLMNYGVSCVSVEDSADFNRFLEGTEIYWDYVDESLDRLKTCETCIKFYLPETVQGMESAKSITADVNLLRELAPDIDMGRLEFEFKSTDEEDWATAWKKYYHTFTVADKLTVSPSWEDSEVANGKALLKIDPGMAFGTGTHESTNLCLEATCRYDFSKPTTVLDLGCGSGILSIAAILLGATNATALDIDPVAVKISAENAALNKINSDRYTPICGNPLDDKDLYNKLSAQSYDLVYANIVSDVIKAYAPLINKVIKQGGTLISSGIIDTRLDEVCASLTSNGLKISETYIKNGWASIICTKE